MIAVESLCKDYGMRHAITDISFEADAGEVLGFLGPNGAGKTTTMRILSGYIPPTSGTARIAGYDVIEQSLEVRKRVGYLPETVPLYEDMSVFEYLKYMGDLRHLPDVEDRVEEVLETVHMVDRADGYVSNLSKGMRQRIGLAQALLHKPEVLILDEPTIGLDPVQIVEVRNLIREIGKERTILLSTHILSEVQQLCDRVLIINHGRIVAEDTPEHLQERLTGVRRAILRVAGDSDGLDSLVSSISGVLRTEPNPDGSLSFESQPGQDYRPDVARAVIQAGFDLLEMSPVSMSLEAIFMELTRDEPRAPQVDDSTLDGISSNEEEEE